jgi:hypothetical protein
MVENTEQFPKCQGEIMSEIVSVVGREILDSRGNPTAEAGVWLSGFTGRRAYKQ